MHLKFDSLYCGQIGIPPDARQLEVTNPRIFGLPYSSNIVAIDSEPYRLKAVGFFYDGGYENGSCR